MPLVEQHGTARVEGCEVCCYLDLHPLLDRMLAHTLTHLAGWTVMTDLQEAGAQLALRSMYVEQFAGASPGRPVELSPEHYRLALLSAPEIKLVADPEV